MKVSIGPYTNRWTCNIHTNYMNKKYDYQWEDNTNRFESMLERIEDTVQTIYNVTVNKYFDNKQRRVKIKIDNYDTWNMDHSLALIILPMLKQLKQTKHGSPYVDLEDVPEELRLHGGASNELGQYDLFSSDEHDQLCWDAMHARWDWVVDEMIFAFECLAGEHVDWEDQFWTGEGVNHTRVWDKEGHIEWGKRMDNGFRLFGKYYRGLWD